MQMSSFTPFNEVKPQNVSGTSKPKSLEQALQDTTNGSKKPWEDLAAASRIFKLVAFPQNMVLALTAIGIASGYLEGFLMVHHFRTGAAILTCLLLGLFPTFLNVAAMIKQGDDFNHLPLSVLFILGFLAGYLMGYKNRSLW